MAQYRTAIVACDTSARVHTRGLFGVAGHSTQIAALANTNPDPAPNSATFSA